MRSCKIINSLSSDCLVRYHIHSWVMMMKSGLMNMGIMHISGIRRHFLSIKFKSCVYYFQCHSLMKKGILLSNGRTDCEIFPSKFLKLYLLIDHFYWAISREPDKEILRVIIPLLKSILHLNESSEHSPKVALLWQILLYLLMPNFQTCKNGHFIFYFMKQNEIGINAKIPSSKLQIIWVSIKQKCLFT